MFKLFVFAALLAFAAAAPGAALLNALPTVYSGYSAPVIASSPLAYSAYSAYSAPSYAYSAQYSLPYAYAKPAYLI